MKIFHLLDDHHFNIFISMVLQLQILSFSNTFLGPRFAILDKLQKVKEKWIEYKSHQIWKLISHQITFNYFNYVYFFWCINGLEDIDMLRYKPSVVHEGKLFL